jgi:hypothetical protein
MCRSIKTLRPPYAEQVTETDVRAVAVQYVRKISGFRRPAPRNTVAFDHAVDEIEQATARLTGGDPGARSSSFALSWPTHRLCDVRAADSDQLPVMIDSGAPSREAPRRTATLVPSAHVPRFQFRGIIGVYRCWVRERALPAGWPQTERCLCESGPRERVQFHRRCVS